MGNVYTTTSLDSPRYGTAGILEPVMTPVDYQFQYTRITVREERVNRDRDVDCSSRIAGVCIHYKVTTDTYNEFDLRHVYSHSVHASRPVGIEFTGHDSGLININSQGSVVVAGDIRNEQGEVTLTARGSIVNRLATSTISAYNLKLTAQEGSVGSEKLALRLDQAKPGNLRLRAHKDLFVEAINGDLVLREATSTTGGRVVLSADEDIRLLGSGRVRGGDVHLTSRTGDIGSRGRNFLLDTQGASAHLAAYADGDIYLEEVSGDLQVDRIVAKNGNVSLSVAGNLLDANGREIADTMVETERRELYQDVRLMGEGAMDSAQDAVANYRNRKNYEYQRYWDIRGVGNDYDGATTVVLGEEKKAAVAGAKLLDGRSVNGL